MTTSFFLSCEMNLSAVLTLEDTNKWESHLFSWTFPVNFTVPPPAFQFMSEKRIPAAI